MIVTAVMDNLFQALLLFLNAHLLRIAGEAPMLTRNHSESLISCKRRHSWIYFFAVHFVGDISCCCASYPFSAHLIELILNYTKLKLIVFAV